VSALEFAGKTGIVTGASRGIGYAVAEVRAARLESRGPRRSRVTSEVSTSPPRCQGKYGAMPSTQRQILVMATTLFGAACASASLSQTPHQTIVVESNVDYIFSPILFRKNERQMAQADYISQVAEDYRRTCEGRVLVVSGSASADEESPSDLAVARATGVAQVLRRLIERCSIHVEAFGSSRPIDQEDSEENRAQNRNVRLTVR
jgi:hypothetical protein